MDVSTTSYDGDGLPPMPRASGEFDALLGSGLMMAPTRPGVMGVLGRYEVLREVGRGAMGLVALARDPDTNELVALKLLHPGLATVPRAVKAFRRDATHLMKLSHPNLLPVFEVAPESQHPYFVTPYVANGSLQDEINKGSSCDEARVLCVAIQLAEALQVVHDRGVVHRDIKPANVLVGQKNHVYLSDFGSAYHLDNDSILDVRRPGWVGTAPYMSPICAAGKTEDGRGDIYSLGALMYTMLSGVPPYTGQDLAEIVRRILSAPPIDLSETENSVSEPMLAVVRWCMAREQRDRYANITDTLNDLIRVRDGDPPIGPGQPRTQKSVIAKALFPLLAVIGFVIVLMGSAWGTSGQRSSGDPPQNNLDDSSSSSKDATGDGLQLAKLADVRKAVVYLFRKEESSYYGDIGILERDLADLDVPEHPRVGDRLDCSIELTSSGYCQAFLINTDGSYQTATLLSQPSHEERKLGTLFRVPNDTTSNYYLDRGRGTQAVFIVVSPHPLRAEDTSLPPESLRDWSKSVVKRYWRFNGVTWRSPTERSEGPAATPPEPVLQVSRFLSRPGRHCLALAFPVD